jgi:hypothetical protein
VIGWYDWVGGREAVLRFGPADGPVVAAALPPFEEANRTRTFAVGLLRALGERGIVGLLPDLPGTGESLVPLDHATLADWRAAFVAAAAPARFTIAIRAGVLIDNQAQVRGRWRLAPQPGEALVRELIRIRHATLREEGTVFDAAEIEEDGPAIPIAGNFIGRRMLRDLKAAEPSECGLIRTVRLDSDAQTAHRKVPGAPLWRRAEPGDERALSTLLAADIADWIARCDA